MSGERDIEGLIEASSLGTPEAKALRDSVPDHIAAAIVERSLQPGGHELRRADDLPGQLQAYRDTVVAGGAIVATAVRHRDGWLITDRLYQALQTAVADVLAGEQRTS